jgi:diadenosine tetraphosphatase ApaH/serine/threonine PP2A family protein phosphatase
VFSDVHANLTALTASLDAAAGRWDYAACLGDLVGYGPDPNEVIDRIRDLAGPVIRGNHDKAACAVDGIEDFNPTARKAMEWTRAQLRPDNLEYLRQLPAGPLETGGLTLVHGALQDEDEYVFSPAQALASLLAASSNVTFFGHTHFQGGFSYRDERIELIQLRPRPGANFAALRLEEGTRYLLNPGSIGQPRDGDARAAFAIADLDHGVVEFWRVPYDIHAVQDRMTGVGAPEPLISRLALGR